MSVRRALHRKDTYIVTQDVPFNAIIEEQAKIERFRKYISLYSVDGNPILCKVISNANVTNYFDYPVYMSSINTFNVRRVGLEDFISVRGFVLDRPNYMYY